MRVKKLELLGFKSFSNKTAIHFEPGVTAIVGPNGSGKSNVVDSIRWVLGEHNPRDVRAPRLEDVIFNGTDQKAPLSMAEVSLTIANEQGLLPISFREVVISRRVYRSGESECFINQAPCRLKDIRELLLGTGLGGGTYAIIEQGHIDMVLSSKPEERRVVFEEASGVAKYLAKKKETMRRLDEVEEHLVRIADIAGEVRRQVAALERQAAKARQYKTQWEQLKTSELRLAADELRDTGSRDRQLDARVAELTSQREQLETQKRAQMATLESCNTSVSAMQHDLQALRTRLVELGSEAEQHDSQRTLKRGWIEELTQQTQQLQVEEGQGRLRAEQWTEQLAALGSESTQLERQLTEFEGQLQQAREQLAGLDTALQQAQGAITQAKAQVFEVAAEASRCRTAMSGTTSRLQTTDAKLARLEEQGTQLANRAEDVRQRRGAAEQERQTLQAQHDDMQQRAMSTQHRLEEARSRRDALAGRLHQSRDQAAAERAHVQLLEELWKHYEGFPEAVKTLMQQPVDGVVGPLVDVIEAASGYEEMVEAALGPLAEAVVVRDRQVLARCRDALRAQQLEHCRFLVLEDCPASAVAAESPTQEGIAGSVKQFLTVQAPYQPLVDWLLNDSWVVDDIQRVLSARSVPHGRMVSRKGDRWDRRSWRFNGVRHDKGNGVSGSQGEPANAPQSAEAGRRIGRKRRWELAQATLASHDAECRRLETEVAQAEQTWQSLLAEQESAKGQLGHLTPAVQKVSAQISQVTLDAKRIEEEQRSVELDIEQLVAQQQELRTALTQATQAVAEAETRQQEIERTLAAAQSARETAEQQRQQWLIAEAQTEATRKAIAQRAQELSARLEEMERDRAQLVQQLDTRSRQRTEGMERIERLQRELEDHGRRGDEVVQERERLRHEEERVAQSLRESEQQRDQILPQVLAVEQQVSSLQQQLHEQSRQQSERSFRRTRIIERLRELYQIDETALNAELHATAEPMGEATRASLTEQVQKLRGTLEGMGAVSLGSVEEYDELKQRHEFLQTQQQDLIKARDDLKASIAQINRAARSQFRETFEKIQQEFRHYYTRLFGGGKAELMLVDPDDVLESGIEIVARPPGKRLQSISLLSGGERALTAIALLFALFKVRPSPFCILDEIDAPLDEANVDRFTKVLEEFLDLSQFILITHNKKTITKADSLYGVTMEEAGISKILSAKLSAKPSRA